MPPYILLTGAGFTRNWGGWLAKELEGDLLGRLSTNDPLRSELQSAANFESALWALQDRVSRGDQLGLLNLVELERVIVESFFSMNLSLAGRPSIEFSNDRQWSITTFLARFDAIFTLNQDLLLELHYDPQLETIRRWAGRCWPGVSGLPAGGHSAHERVSGRRLAASGATSPGSAQPIYKLHGSVDWADDSGRLFIVGGGKELQIERKPLLSDYFRIFRERLNEPHCRLMIVGYGFADEHVNRLLVESAVSNASLGVFHIHPDGRDAIHRGLRERTPIYREPELARLRCIGESRRSLSSTFGGDDLEHYKVMRFFE